MKPRLLELVNGYTQNDFKADCGAGIAVALVALPLALAIGAASGMKPENGLITAIVGGLLVSLLGGSRVQIGGPAAAFIGLIYATVIQFGFAGLLIASIMSGCMLVAMGVLKLGSLIKLVPESVIIGFTNGISILIAAAQIKNFFGLSIEKLPATLLHQLPVIAKAFPSINLAATLLGCCTLLTLKIWSNNSWAQRTKVPATVMATVLASIGALAVNTLFTVSNTANHTTSNSPLIATIGSSFGGFGPELLTPAMPSLIGLSLASLLLPALSLAMLGAIESLLCARIADEIFNRQTNQTQQHNPNQELMGQGIANVIVPFFGGVPVTGTIARTITNIRSGARTPIAGIIHALILLAILLIAAPLANVVPMTVLAAILLWIAASMFDWQSLVKRQPSCERITILATTLLTVFIDLSLAVFLGVALYWLLSQRARTNQA